MTAYSQEGEHPLDDTENFKEFPMTSEINENGSTLLDLVQKGDIKRLQDQVSPMQELGAEGGLLFENYAPYPQE